MPLNFPKVKDVAYELRVLNATFLHESFVTLQILDDGRWWVHEGSNEGNLDYHGYTVSVQLPGCRGRKNKPCRFSSEEVARNLIDKIADQYLREKDASAD
jgi:hypothetical protein